MNIQGLHNLCVVYVERGKLKQALECLQRAHNLAPEESYILKHLNIVRQRIVDLSEAAAAQQRQKNKPSNDNNVDMAYDDIDDADDETVPKSNENNTTTTDDTTKSNKQHVDGDSSSNSVDGSHSTRKNQKHPDDSTISEATNSINPNGIRRPDDQHPPNKIKIDAVDAETENNGYTTTKRMEQKTSNRRAGTHQINNNGRTQFGHDSDEPSSGTS